jgi:hypothetical protein
VYGDVPPDTVRLMLPLFPEKQEIFDVVVVVPDKACDGWVMVAEETEVQPFASLTVTVYVPVTRPLIACVVEPLLQL